MPPLGAGAQTEIGMPAIHCIANVYTKRDPKNSHVRRHPILAASHTAFISSAYGRADRHTFGRHIAP